MRLRARAVRTAAILGLFIGATLVPGAAYADPAPLTDKSVAVAVLDMNPTTPAASADDRPLAVTLSLTNNTDQTLYDVQIGAEREAPVTQQTILEDLYANPRVLQASKPLKPLILTAALAPHASQKVVYRTTTSEQDEDERICLCQTGIYPIDFTVSAATVDGGEQTQVGFAQTYLPSFIDGTQPVQVSWLWPLIDRPHRAAGETTFVDDDLAQSVASGGRLDRALTVIERVEPRVRLTLVIDPELIAELATMADHYDVRGANGTTTAGAGGPAAQAWLTRLRAVITSSDVSLTPYADPDIDALARSGRTWSTGVDTQVRTVLSGAVGDDIAWPPGETITSDALRQVVADGASAVVVNDRTLTAGAQEIPRPDAVATLPTTGSGRTSPVAIVTDSAIQKFVTPVLTRDAAGARQLPQLVSELAVRAAQRPDGTHYIAITPDRYVDADPSVASRAILDTSLPTWAQATTVRTAARSVTPVDRGQLTEPAGSGAAEVSQSVLDSAAATSRFVTAFTSALAGSDDTTKLIGGLPQGVQRCESAAWRTDPAGGERCVALLADAVQAWRNGVTVARPSNGSYTLTSRDAPLFINLRNALTVPVKVRLSLRTVNGVVGFSTDPIPEQTIPARQSVQLRVSAHVQRTGRFKVEATLATPDGTPIGNSVQLTVRSTALGAIGVIITAVAGGVLVLALVLRLVRRLRTRTKATADPEPATSAPTASVVHQ